MSRWHSFGLAVVLAAACGGQGGGGQDAGLRSPPAAPAEVVARPGTGQVTVQWAGVPDATSYDVYLESTEVLRHASAVSPFNISGLENGRRYVASVTASNGFGESARSERVAVTPGLPAPTGLSASGGDAAVVLRWDPLSGPGDCQAFWAAVSGVSKDNYPALPESGTAILGSYGTEFVIEGLKNGVTYHFVLAARTSASGLTLDSAEASARTENGATATWTGAAEVRDDSATVHGAILNPVGTTARLRFEYGATSAYGSSADALGSAVQGQVPVEATIGDLAPEANVHFRLVAENAAGIFAGEDRTFRTLRRATTLVDGLEGPTALAVDRDWLYWVEQDGELKRVSKEGGAGIVLLGAGSAFNLNAGVALAGADVVWTDATSVRRVSIAGGETFAIATARTGPAEPMISGSDVLWREGPPGGGIFRAPLAGGAVVQLYSHAASSGFEALQSDGSSVYWTDFFGVKKAPLAPGTPLPQPVVIAALARSSPTALVAGSIYFAGPRGLSRVSVEGGAPFLLVPDEAPFSLVSDGHALYWFTYAGVLRRVDLAGGPPTDISAARLFGGASPTYAAVFAVDSDHVYWIEDSPWPQRAIRRVPK